MPLLPDLNFSSINTNDPQKQLESLVKQLNEWGRLISNEDRTKIIKDDSGTERLLQGYQEDGFDNGNVGIKVSREGESVLGASGNELIWSTDFNLYKVVDSGTLTIPELDLSANGTDSYSDSQNSELYTHNLGITPVVLGFVEFIDSPGSYGVMPHTLIDSGGGGGGIRITHHRIASNGTFVRAAGRGVAYGPAYSTGTYTNGAERKVKFFLLRETAS